MPSDKAPTLEELKAMLPDGWRLWYESDTHPAIVAMRSRTHPLGFRHVEVMADTYENATRLMSATLRGLGGRE